MDLLRRIDLDVVLQLVGIILVVAGVALIFGGAVAMIVGGVGLTAYGTLAEMARDETDEGGPDGPGQDDQ